MASVKVAVRVRPLNQRELTMGAQRIIEMDGKKTRILNLKAQQEKQVGESVREKYRDFTFDFSYWSFDPQDENFASQEQVFLDLGMDVVDNAFEGYNACVFAYGQTGSGKTHTMMGSSSSLGLIPRVCKDMFNRMNQGKEKGVTYRTEVSYLEIYNERVKDLLKKNQSHSLRVREHNKYGIYVEDLSKHLVMDYADIEEVMQKGNSNRTTASTNMNDVSSRSHAIFTMTFVQASFVGSMPSETISKIHLVDLAGSERADASGATGQRLKEGGHINKSLVTLGSVISALADCNAGRADSQSKSHKQNIGHIPYRNSVLTWLLKDSLGGNAKTIMIATISPADVNHSETLSTLRYANRAKNIINKPTINEDLNVKLIRELRAEITKLKNMLGTNVDSSDSVLEELHEKEAKAEKLCEEWQHKWAETQKILMEQTDLALRKVAGKAGTGVVLDSQMPHLIGIDDDLLSTGITLYHLKEGETRIGSEEVENHDIILKGPGLECSHCSILLENGVATLVPSNGAICIVNGLQIDRSCRLSQGCVIRLGTNVVFRYNDPAEAEKLRRENKSREGSRSHLNLSRLSFLSRSTSDLAWSSENLNAAAATAITGEENNLLEEKRKQLEAEEARLQKESQELLEQKALLEEQKSHYQLLQQEKEEAWKKAEQLNKTVAVHLAQKEVEEHRLKLEQEYAAHKKRLSDDWKKLEQQEQDPTLKSISPSTLDTLRMSTEEATTEMKRLIEQVNEQKMIVLESLENDCDKEVLNHHLSVLQDLRNRYLEIECIVDNTARRRWLFEDEDSTFDFDKGEDADTTVGDSELDESEAHSSVDQDDHIQLMIDQGVQRRLLEIFEQLKSGQKPNFSSTEASALTRHRSHRRSMPSGLNNVYTSGSDDDASSSSPPPLPRSLSMNSGVWAVLNQGLGIESTGAVEITITVPTYYLRGSGANSHFQYEINIVSPTERWSILRRYQRFRELYHHMKKKYSKVSKIPFPPKKYFGRTSENVARERRKQLETFLQTLICVCSTIPHCPLYNCGSRPPNFDVRHSLVAFSSFFEKGFFEGTKYGTS